MKTQTGKQEAGIETVRATISSRGARARRGTIARLCGGTAAVVMALALLTGRSEAALTANGLSAMNGLKVHNGLSAINGLKVHNGLSAINGLKVHNGMLLANGLKVHNGLVARVWAANGIDPRAPLSAAVKSDRK
jgi:putative intracellular protease/amidase